MLHFVLESTLLLLNSCIYKKISKGENWLKISIETGRRNLVSYIKKTSVHLPTIKNGGWLIGDKVLRVCAGLLVGIWMARYMGPSKFGVLNYAIAFVSIFSILGAFAHDNIVVRQLIQKPKYKKEIISSAVCLRLIGSIICIFIIQISALIFVEKNSVEYIIITIISFGLIFQSLDAVDLWFQANSVLKYIIISKDLAFLIFLLFKVYLITGQYDLIYFSFAILGESVTGALFSTGIYLYKSNSFIFHKKTTLIIKKTILESWPLGLSGIAIAFYLRVDQIMIGNMSGSAELGLYAVAVRFSDIWFFIATAISTLMYPILLKNKSLSYDKFINTYKKICRITFYFSLMLAIILSIFSSFIVDIFYGKQYIMSGPMLQILAWSVISVFIAAPFTMMLIMEGRQKYILVSTLIGLILNMGMNYILIPLYGGLGASIVTVATYSASGYLIYFIFPETRNLAKSTANYILSTS